MSRIEQDRQAAFGLLSRDIRHEVANLLAVAAAWVPYRNDDSEFLHCLLAKSAEALQRLNAIERSLSLCAIGITPHVLSIESPSLVDIVECADTLTAPRRRELGLELTWKVDDVVLRGSAGSHALCMTLILRAMIASAAAAKAPSLSLFSEQQEEGVVITLSHPGPAKIDLHWHDVVARDCVAELGGKLEMSQRSCDALLILTLALGHRRRDAGQ